MKTCIFWSWGSSASKVHEFDVFLCWIVLAKLHGKNNHLHGIKVLSYCALMGPAYSLKVWK